MMNRWHDSFTLLDLNRRDSLRLLDAYMNFLLLGGTGSGKTTFAQYLTRSLLEAQVGALFLCVKGDSIECALRWAKASGRLVDVVMFGPGHGHGFNFLDGLAVEEALAVLLEAMTLLRRRETGRGEGENNEFFRLACERMLRLALVSILGAERRITLEALRKFISSVPRDPNDPKARQSYAVVTIKMAQKQFEAEGRGHEMVAAMDSLHDFVEYPQATRESIRATAQVLFDKLTYEPLLSLLGRNTTVSPVDILERGKIVIVTPAIHDERATGQILAAIWKAMLQRAILARTPDADRSTMRPVLIWGDEAHELVTASDVRFVSSSRSQRGITLYATQTITSLEETIGGSATATLLAGLRNRFVCRSDDPQTIKWLADTLGEDSSRGLPDVHTSVRSELVRRNFASGAVRSLKQGSERDRLLEAIAIRAGDQFTATGRPWAKVVFRHTPPDGAIERLLQGWATNELRLLTRPRGGAVA